MTDTTSGGSARWDGDDAPTQTLPAVTPASGPELTGFSAGVVGAALTAVGVWGLHVLTRGEGVAASVGWALLLVLAFTALGKGITLLRRALTPLSTVLSASVAGIPPLLRAVTGIIIGGAGIWWVMRGHASGWWAQLTDADQQWTLPAQLVQVAIIVVAGALLFGGAKTLGKLLFANSGSRQQHSPNQDASERWRQWWASHPGLGLTLLAGAATLIFLSGYVVPRVSGWLTGDDPMAALASITAILTLALLANTWWWRALTGWWTWAHTPNGPGGPTPIGQIYAGAGVLALIAFSATAFGLATFSSYLPQNAAVASADPCGDRCGGGGNGQGSYGPNASQFQPPQMPGQQPDYQGGINQPPLDQNSGISIYNQNPAQGGMQQSQNLGPQMSGQHAAHGDPLPNYGPWQPDAQPPAQAPAQQAPVQQVPQAPQQPAQAPQNPAGQQPVQQAPQQPVQQAPQQPGAQQPQGQPAQQPAQQNPPQQSQPGQQPQNPANQQTPQQQAPQQQPQKEPDTPKKNPIDPTDLATAATRRGSQQAGQQAAQQGAQQATQQATQQTQQATQQASQQATKAGEQGAEKAAEKGGEQAGEKTEINSKIGNVGDVIDKSAARAAEQASVPKQAPPLRTPTGASQAQLNQAAARAAGDLETVSKFGRRLGLAGNVLEAANGAMEGYNEVQAGKSIAQATVDVAPKTVGSIAGGVGGAIVGAEWGASAGFFIGGPPGAIIGAGAGALVGGLAGSEFGKNVGSLVSTGLKSLFSW